MFGQLDLHLQASLEATLQAIKAQPVLVDDVFHDLPTQTQAMIRDAFASMTVPVKLGYPRDATELPGVFVVLGTMAEEQQTIGTGFPEDVVRHVVGEVPGDPLYWNERSGTFMRSTVRLCCWTENANVTVWLQNVVTWALLRERDALTDAGFIEQRINATDLAPLPQWFPSFVYRRDVTLSALHPVTFVTKVLPIAEVDATATMGEEVVRVTSS